MHRERRELNQKRARQIRQIANELSLRKLARLDFGDTALVADVLDRIRADLHRVRTIVDSGCSQLIELLEVLGADLSPTDDEPQEGGRC